ncbi:MAG TPA: AAA family ATPase [Acidimicrobiales bacterium]|nr:AAA family ATPase [Acidimicrobiales bacterium]
MRRVSVVGNAGSGKTTLARRLASALGVPLIELDAIHHLPNWEPIDPARFQAIVEEMTAADGWVIDGNYRVVVSDGPVWARADTVVWLDPPRRTVMRQVIQRSLWRVLTRRQLWNQNRERLSNLFAWDPEESVIRWAWTQHDKYRDRFESAMGSPDLAHLRFVRLRSRRQAERLLREAAASG